MTDEAVLDPWVAEWIAGDPQRAVPFDDFSPEILELARGPVGAAKRGRQNASPPGPPSRRSPTT